MSIYESSVTNPKKQLEFYKQLSEQLQQENQELKKQLEKKYSKIGTLTNEILYEENTKLINQQEEFIKYLEDMLDDENDIFSVARGKDVLQKYKEINRKVIRRR